METYGIIPDHLFCVAGGTSPEQIGFLADMKPEGLISCLEINYYAAIFIAQVVLKLWVSKAPTAHSRQYGQRGSLNSLSSFPEIFLPHLMHS
jgi:3-dehydrosphinganine reductase